MTATFDHVAVLSREVIAGLQIQPGGHYLDATVGAGGHSGEILAAAPDVQLTALDRDGEAIAAAQSHLPPTVQFWRGNFADYQPGATRFDGIVADLGVSSPQLDHRERGFSFQQDAPLDMRMDQGQDLTAAAILNHQSETDLVRIFSHYGEERFSKRIARRIVEQRPLQTTTDLVEVIMAAIPASCRHGRIHPATRVFQALRIAVNGELEALERFLNVAPQWLKPGGRIAIISFHSLEDRIVKYAFRGSELLQIITKKPLMAQADEQRENRRSRSAKLRLAQRVSKLE
ncbi:16S rRNA (cytosine(1402)-N(4))-methyltransferase RsmH [Spirulina sp. CCNP1310]|uniref:16S rRNA (cytosine(1402)-N(4))-methyltransferase RsmH n=1 Tax=Spirulina sp. CCNP1310 TaxID=3110249 RepID=UPI002B21DC3B|nr:16S rRNA (cytosine(1402)-N(4))-methyltransferase RsmH [Spirulina sp. CCNP1310]MEA5421471.1 16S rRNA (cytosine(1402)-N(4))-methyltransferase RsmH [Spirulina sp. CCNP1310]